MAETDSASMPTGTVRGQLISPHYLAHQLVNRAEWKTLATDPRATQIEQLFERVKATNSHRFHNGAGLERLLRFAAVTSGGRLLVQKVFQETVADENSRD
jgi:hypothetical protein